MEVQGDPLQSRVKPYCRYCQKAPKVPKFAHGLSWVVLGQMGVHLNIRSKFLVFATAALILSGCATSRSVLDITVPDVPNPTGSQAVKITDVVDKRVFEIKPNNPAIPSLQNDEVKDLAITQRAVARKRNTYGAALGDVLLPEGQTVTQLTRAALVNALRDSGYRVVAAGEPGYDTATPVGAEIQQFWAWMTPGFWQIKLEYRARIQLNGDWPLTGESRMLEGDALLTTSAAFESEWQKVISDGLTDLIRNLKAMLKRVSP